MADEYTTKYNNSYALVVGINSYTDPRFVPLGEAEEDAQRMADVLGAPPYNFSVGLLLGEQATKQAVQQALFQLRSTEPDDRVLVYLACHAYTLTDRFEKESGYFALYDTFPEQDFTALHMEEVVKLRRHAPAKHVGFIFDACFSGQALGLTRAQSVSVERFLTRRSYQVLSAGAGDQTVSDFNSLTSMIVERLKDPLVNEHGLMTWSELGLYAQQTMAADSGQMQIPQFGHLRGSQGGDFVFYVETGARLPLGTRQALESEQPLLRIGGAAELVPLMKDEDEELATLARTTLEALFHNDEDERVRNAAEALLNEGVEAVDRILRPGHREPSSHGSDIFRLLSKRVIETEKEHQERFEEILSQPEPESPAPLDTKVDDDEELDPQTTYGGDLNVSTLLGKITDADTESHEVEELLPKMLRRTAEMERPETEPMVDTAELKRRGVEEQLETIQDEDIIVDMPEDIAEESPQEEALDPEYMAAVSGMYGAVTEAPPAVESPSITDAEAEMRAEQAERRHDLDETSVDRAFNVQAGRDMATVTGRSVAPEPASNKRILMWAGLAAFVGITLIAVVGYVAFGGSASTPAEVEPTEAAIIPTATEGAQSTEPTTLPATVPTEDSAVVVEPTEDTTVVVEPTTVPVVLDQIAFVSDRDGNKEIYLMNVDGSEQVNLTNSIGEDFDPEWSPDGSRIAFVSTRDGDREIFVMNGDGSGVVQITNNLAADNEPHWVSTTELVFISEFSGLAQLYLVDITSGQEAVQISSNTIDDRQVAISSDGTRIGFVSQHLVSSEQVYGDGEIYVYNLVNGSLTQLTEETLGAFMPAWSPDGARLVFFSVRDFNREIYVMTANGDNQINLTNNPNRDYDPAWSPDGSTIAFLSERTGTVTIFLMDVTGNNQRILADGVEMIWSPDSTQVLFSSVSDGDTDLYIINVDGTGLTQLTENFVSDTSPVWRP